MSNEHNFKNQLKGSLKLLYLFIVEQARSKVFDKVFQVALVLFYIAEFQKSKEHKFGLHYRPWHYRNDVEDKFALEIISDEYNRIINQPYIHNFYLDEGKSDIDCLDYT